MADYFGLKSRVIITTPGVDDDSAVIEAEDGGAVFDLSQPGSVAAALVCLAALLLMPGHRARIHELAVRHRGLNRAREACQTLLPGPLAS